MIYVKSLFAGLGTAALMGILLIVLLTYYGQFVGKRATGGEVGVDVISLLRYLPLRIGVGLGFLVGSCLTYRWLRVP
jgi:hypothetical protein